MALIVAISLHVLAAVSWVGMTFAVVRMDGIGAERIFRPQMSAAAVAILAGGYLWHRLHDGRFDSVEWFLGAGVVAALVAVVAQAAFAGPAIAKLRRGANDDPRARSTILTANRIAAFLLALTTIAMAAARYV